MQQKQIQMVNTMKCIQNIEPRLSWRKEYEIARHA